MGYGLWGRGKMGAAEQITAARMPQKGTTLQVKMKAGGYGGRVIGGWVTGYGGWVIGGGAKWALLNR